MVDLVSSFAFSLCFSGGFNSSGAGVIISWRIACDRSFSAFLSVSQTEINRYNIIDDNHI